MRVPVQPRTLEELQKLTTPAAVAGGNMEAFRDVLTDTQTYAAAGPTGGRLSFFATTNSDPSLSNAVQAGTVPDPEYWQLYYLRAFPILGPQKAANPSRWADVFNLMVGYRPMVTLTIMNKPYGPWPMRPMGVSGPQVFGYADAAVAGVNDHEYAQAGADLGGFCLDGALWLLPKASFRVTIQWGAASTVAADTLIAVELDGTHYRAIR